jgi:glycosyltransferase involved in cell wall biosynthesis
MRVGFVPRYGDWMGGRNYFKNLFLALETHPHPVVEPVIFCGAGRGAKLRSDFPASIVVETGMLNRLSPSWTIAGMAAKLGCENPLTSRLLEKHGVMALSHELFMDTKYRSRLKTLWFIADFQHLHLPALFSAKELSRRDTFFRRRSARCDSVILSSEAAKADFTSLFPEQAHKAAVLRFVSSPQTSGGVPSAEELRRKYQFKGAFFLLPNQFWKHKNHRAAISALQILKQRGQAILILATGLANDPRHPTYFAELMEFVKECDVRESFRVLGSIPDNDLLGLMRNCVAILNPSLFEGWSTSVEEAKSLGKTVLLSDIAVHREQTPDLGVYFHPLDAEGLASKLWSVLEAYDPNIDAGNQESAGSRLPGRRVEFAESYQRIVLNIVGSPEAI